MSKKVGYETRKNIKKSEGDKLVVLREPVLARNDDGGLENQLGLSYMALLNILATNSANNQRSSQLAVARLGLILTLRLYHSVGRP